MEVKYRNLLLSVVIVTIIYYLIFFPPVTDDITLPICAMVTLILLGGSFCFWALVFYIIFGFIEKTKKIIVIPDIRIQFLRSHQTVFSDPRVPHQSCLPV